MRTTPRILALVAVGVIGGSLTACGGKSDDTSSAAGGPITVKATDTTCDVAKSTLDAGTHVFSINNTGAKVTEFYVYAAGDRVMGEVENITPGLSRELRVELPAGSYQATCKPGMIGTGIRNVLTVSGSAPALTEDAALQQASTNYTAYITSQSEALVQKTTEFATAVKAGDVAKAKALYPIARTYYERIEPVAEIFGDLDPKIDGREDDATAALPFSGFHKIEKDLWVSGDISKDGPVADQLLKDVTEGGDQGQGREAVPAAARERRQGAAQTRSPTARSPARRTATRTPTCGTSPPTWRARRPPSPPCARPWSSAAPIWSSRSTRRSPPSTPSWPSTAPVTAGSCRTSSPSPS